MGGQLRIRPAVRAVMVTPDAHVLMVRFEFPTRTVWTTPGGGIEPGEDDLRALRRELAEEVGLVDATIGPHVWHREHHVSFPSGRWDGQRENYYLVPVEARFEPRPALSWDELRAERMHEIRWWSLGEVERSSDVWFAPRRLPELLRALVDDGPPGEPIDAGV